MTVLEELVKLQPELAPDRRAEFPWVIANMTKKGDVLDVGCGGSIIQKYLLARGFNVVAVDVSKFLGGYYFNREKRECFVLCDCFHPPFRNEVFDYILIVSTLEHFPAEKDDIEILQTLSVLLRKNGRVFVTLPYGFSHCLFNEEGIITRIYNDNDLQRLIAESGLWLKQKKIFVLEGYKDVVCLEMR